MSKPNYGHRSWNAWNVSLWIANDEPLYRLALDCLATTRNRRSAARKFIDRCGRRITPDGATFNQACVYEAMERLT